MYKQMIKYKTKRITENIQLNIENIIITLKNV